MRAPRLVASPLALVLAFSGLARADEPPAEAKKAFGDGKQAYERGDFDNALRLFQKAQSIAPAPSLYYNIGMAEERLGRYEDAGAAFDRYLAETPAPRDDEERTTQDNLRARAAADHDRARRAVQNEPPPQPIPAPRYAPYPPYGYAPYGYAPVAMPVPREQRIEAARRHRNNGIALLAVGGVLFIVGIGLTEYAVHTHDDAGRLSGGIGASVGLIVGLTLIIPGAIATGKWQSTLNRELKTPENGAAVRRAALDVAVPAVALTNVASFALSTPAIRF